MTCAVPTRGTAAAATAMAACLGRSPAAPSPFWLVSVGLLFQAIFLYSFLLAL